MPIVINGFELTDAMVEQELPHHQDAPQPLQAATQELVFRRLLIQAAADAGMDTTDEDEAITQLLTQQVTTPTADDTTCERYFRENSALFVQGELAEVSHILFQVTPTVNLELLKQKATEVLALITAKPTSFAELAREFSNCPSGQQGGSLGQLSRGQCVPEFEKVIFKAEVGLYPHLLESRFGLHIILIHRKLPGQLPPYSAVANQIRDYLERQSYQTALRHYLQHLAANASITGIDMPGLGDSADLLQ